MTHVCVETGPRYKQPSNKPNKEEKSYEVQ